MIENLKKILNHYTMMNQSIKTENSKEYLKNFIQKNRQNYGDVLLKIILVKESNGIYLYLADVTIHHKEDPPINEQIFDYDHAVIATIRLDIDELLKFLDDIELEEIELKSLGRIKIPGSFDQDCYHISSRTRYAGYYDDWPSLCGRFSSKHNTSLQNVYLHLSKPGQPAYPNVYEACHAFFQHEYSPNQNSPVGINFMIPDYRSRIKFLEIAEKQISVLVETKEISMDKLLIQAYCKKGEKEFFNPDDLQLDSSGSAKFILPFIPDYIEIYLLDQITGDTIDSKAYGKWYTDKNDGIIVKTSKESVETMISSGESQFVEFKRDIDKDKFEFLESIISFANTNDGTILLGIDDECRVIGFFEDFEKTERKIRGLVSGNCEPDLEFTIEEIQLESRPIIVIKVKEGKNKPYILVGKSAYKRVEKDDLVFKRLDFDSVYSKQTTSQDNVVSGL